MRIAFFSPLPPAKSGIADYASALLDSLRPLAEVETFAERPASFDPGRFDVCLYQIGNNPFHAAAYEMALEHPGVVVLHEANLHHLVAHLTIRRDDWEAYMEEVRINGGSEAVAYAERYVRSLERGPDYEGVPMLRRLAQRSRGFIVHSDCVGEEIRRAGFDGPLARIWHGAWILDAERNAWRDRLGLDELSPLIGIFGFLKPYKRIAQSLRAFRRLVQVEPRARMILAGEPHPELHLHSLIESLRLDEHVRVLGFTPIADFNGYIGACDIVLNLRYPTVGESSGTLLRALGMGKAVIVSDVGSFREYPDNILLKAPIDATEEDHVFEYLNLLLSRPDLARNLGTSARDWVRRECSWDTVAKQYLTFLSQLKRATPLADPAPQTDPALAPLPPKPGSTPASSAPQSAPHPSAPAAAPESPTRPPPATASETAARQTPAHQPPPPPTVAPPTAPPATTAALQPVPHRSTPTVAPPAAAPATAATPASASPTNAPTTAAPQPTPHVSAQTEAPPAAAPATTATPASASPTTAPTTVAPQPAPHVSAQTEAPPAAAAATTATPASAPPTTAPTPAPPQPAPHPSTPTVAPPTESPATAASQIPAHQPPLPPTGAPTTAGHEPATPHPDGLTLADEIRSWTAPEARTYVEAHITRLERTLQITPPGERILEMGAYLQITPVLRTRLGYTEVSGCYYGPAGRQEHRKAVSEHGVEFECVIDLLDAENDAFPYPNEHFCTVLCGELIEHLSSDPMHMMTEINRILRPGGHLVLTTPNIVSLRAIAGVLQGFQPGLFTQYLRPRDNGDSDARHSREYTPREIADLLVNSGFEVTLLETGPFLDEPHPEHSWVRHLLDRYMLPADLRGDGIYAVGRKTGPVRERYPSWLYS